MCLNVRWQQRENKNKEDGDSAVVEGNEYRKKQHMFNENYKDSANGITTAWAVKGWNKRACATWVAWSQTEREER